MLDYIFFHREPFNRFVEFVRHKGAVPETKQDDEGFGVSLPEDTEEGLLAEIEVQYDQLMDLDRQLFESEQDQDAGNYQVAGILLNLASGNSVYADVDSDVLARVMGVVTADELGRMVQAIVDAVESPDEQTFCQRMRNGDN